ncbi:ABC transporter D family member 1 [Gossypium arboreum]|uniref:ABC transporter D family member 1 n=1 Tax=Gossypium arboreum TaxID=29729 RepID=A0A0B0PBC6_GOSAR|nr:ABC transporter D family member 1 [Gossypium arboreum]
MISKAVLYFLYFSLYIVTSDLLFCDIASNISLKSLLMVFCTLTKYVSSPLGLIFPLRLIKRLNSHILLNISKTKETKLKYNKNACIQVL